MRTSVRGQLCTLHNRTRGSSGTRARLTGRSASLHLSFSSQKPWYNPGRRHIAHTRPAYTFSSTHHSPYGSSMENQTYGRVQVPQNQRTLMSEARSRTQSIRRAAPRHSVSSPDILVEQQHGHTYAYTRSSPRASYFDRPENATKSLFTRGGQALRKKTTKLSLNLTTPNGSGDISLEHSVFESLKLGLHRGRLFQEAASKRSASSLRSSYATR